MRITSLMQIPLLLQRPPKVSEALENLVRIGRVGPSVVRQHACARQKVILRDPPQFGAVLSLCAVQTGRVSVAPTMNLTMLQPERCAGRHVRPIASTSMEIFLASPPVRTYQI
jgi:hypothetical protein